MPPKSTNAPNLASLVTTPFLFSPFLSSFQTISLLTSFSAFSITLLDRTMFLFSLSSSIILTSKVLPLKSSKIFYICI